MLVTRAGLAGDTAVPGTGSNLPGTPMQGALEGKGPEEPRIGSGIELLIPGFSKLRNTGIRQSRMRGACGGKLSRGTGEIGLCKSGVANPTHW